MTILSIFAFILLILIPITILVSYAENFEKENNDNIIDVTRAEKLIDFGNYYGLLSYTQELERDHPDNIDVLFYRGVALWGINIHQKSIEYQDKVLEINPKHKLALYYKSDSLYHLKKYDESLQVIEKALAIDVNFQKGIIQKEKILANSKQTLVSPFIPSESELMTRKATLLAKTGDFQGAIRFVDKAIESDPRNVDSLNVKGWILLQEEKLDEATVWFEKVLEIDPKMTHSLYNKGIVLFQQGQMEQALVSFEKTLEIDPNYERAKTMKNLTIKQLEKPHEIKPNPISLIKEPVWNDDYKNWWVLDYIVIGIIVVIILYFLKKRINPV